MGSGVAALPVDLLHRLTLLVKDPLGAGPCGVNKKTTRVRGHLFIPGPELTAGQKKRFDDLLCLRRTLANGPRGALLVVLEPCLLQQLRVLRPLQRLAGDPVALGGWLGWKTQVCLPKSWQMMIAGTGKKNIPLQLHENFPGSDSFLGEV